MSRGSGISLVPFIHNLRILPIVFLITLPGIASPPRWTLPFARPLAERKRSKQPFTLRTSASGRDLRWNQLVYYISAVSLLHEAEREISRTD